jgi:RNA polymerase sigma-70 factor (ECF subfamily)
VTTREAASRPAADPAFARTRWSLVLGTRAASGDAAGANGTLDDLAQRYWYPVYAYVRRSGHPAEIANDLCHAFFAALPAQLRDLDPARCGRFRDVLLARLQDFLTADWRRGEADAARDTTPTIGTDLLEARSQRDHPQGSTPERAFQRSFALEVLARSLARLRLEADQGGRADMFDALTPYLSADPPPGQYALLADQLRTPALVLVIAVKRLRQRFRELADDELMETVASPRDLAAERAAMLSLLAGDGASDDDGDGDGEVS